MTDGNDDKAKWLDRLLKLSPLLLGLLFLVKVYGVTHFSPTNAATLITAAPVVVFTGILVQYEGIIMAALAAASLWFAIFQWRTNGAQKRWIPVALIVAAFAICLTPVLEIYLTLLMSILPWLLYLVIKWYWTQRHPNAKIDPVAIAVPVAALLVGAFVLLTIDRPWLPPEVMTFKRPIRVNVITGERSQRPVVYILSEQDSEVTVLVDDSRNVIHASSLDVSDRQNCILRSLQGSAGEPLLWALLHVNYGSHGIVDCRRLTDQSTEKANR